MTKLSSEKRRNSSLAKKTSFIGTATVDLLDQYQEKTLRNVWAGYLARPLPHLNKIF